MSIFSKELKINNIFEVIFDNGTDQSSSKEKRDTTRSRRSEEKEEKKILVVHKMLNCIYLFRILINKNLLPLMLPSADAVSSDLP